MNSILISTTQILFIFYAVVIFVSCDEDVIIPEEPIESPEVFVPCNQTIFEALEKYLDTTWTAEGLRQFIQGTWRFHAIQVVGHDTVRHFDMPYERELRFTETTMDAFQPYDQFLGSGEYIIEPASPDSDNDLFKIEPITNNIEIGGLVSGILIPCNSDLVFYKNYVDLGDQFYRKIE